MKHLTILTLLLTILNCNLQGQDFGAIGTQWHYSEHAGGACPGNCEFLHLESVEDTVINGRTTHKITQIYHRHTGAIDQLPSIYLYEQLDTVFMWSFSRSKFLTTYIFNGSIDDTLTLDAPNALAWPDTTYRLVIDDITNVVVDGVQLKKYSTTALDNYTFWNGGYFMDKIGGLDWFLPRTVIIPEAGGPIRCFSDTEIDTSFQGIPCDYVLYTSVDEVEYDGIEIYPNPTSGLLTIKSNEPVKKLKLFNTIGELIATIHETTFDLTSLPCGQFILEVHMTTGYRVKRKIIKTYANNH